MCLVIYFRRSLKEGSRPSSSAEHPPRRDRLRPSTRRTTTRRSSTFHVIVPSRLSACENSRHALFHHHSMLFRTKSTAHVYSPFHLTTVFTTPPMTTDHCTSSSMFDSDASVSPTPCLHRLHGTCPFRLGRLVSPSLHCTMSSRSNGSFTHAGSGHFCISSWIRSRGSRLCNYREQHSRDRRRHVSERVSARPSNSRASRLRREGHESSSRVMMQDANASVTHTFGPPRCTHSLFRHSQAPAQG